MGVNETLVLRTVIVLVLFSLIYTTIKSVVKGIKEGIDNGRDIFNGVPIEKIREKERLRALEKEEEELSKMNSKFYRITHPLEYLNCILIRKIRERAN